jgi:ABC-2 type transport system ATP-binding protein
MAARRVVSVEDLHKVYPGGVEAVRGLWFDVLEGEIFGLLGPNAAGKSTTFGVLTTTVRPTRGRATVAGYDVRRHGPAVRRSIGVVFQESVLDDEFTGRQNLRLHARLWSIARHTAERRIDELLAVMGLTDRADAHVRTYSGGMRRRLELARALLARPRVVFLDEPTAGLDPTVRDDLWRLVQRLRRDEGVTVVVSTHYLEEAEEVCDRVAIVDRGRVAAQGCPRELVEGLGRDLVEVKVDDDPSFAVTALSASGLGSQPPWVRGDDVVLPFSADPRDVTSLLAELHGLGLGITATTVRPTTLADVFAALTTAPHAGAQDIPA